MKEAYRAALQSTCTKKQVGAVLYRGNEMVSPGYGGSAHGCEVCKEQKGTFTHDTCWSIHAEMRVVLNAMQKGLLYRVLGNSTYNDFSSYVTHGPCDQCLKLLDYVGIRTCIFHVPYKTDYSKWSQKVNVYQMEMESNSITLLN